MGGIRKFTNAKIFLNRKGWIEDIVSPKNNKQLPRNLFIPENDLKYMLFDAWNKFVLFGTTPDFDIATRISARGSDATIVLCLHSEF